MRHRLSGIPTYRLNGLGKGDELAPRLYVPVDLYIYPCTEAFSYIKCTSPPIAFF